MFHAAAAIYRCDHDGLGKQNRTALCKVFPTVHCVDGQHHAFKLSMAGLLIK